MGIIPGYRFKLRKKKKTHKYVYVNSSFFIKPQQLETHDLFLNQFWQRNIGIIPLSNAPLSSSVLSACQSVFLGLPLYLTTEHFTMLYECYEVQKCQSADYQALKP